MCRFTHFETGYAAETVWGAVRKSDIFVALNAQLARTLIVGEEIFV